jgi:hypothetical protein
LKCNSAHKKQLVELVSQCLQYAAMVQRTYENGRLRKNIHLFSIIGALRFVFNKSRKEQSEKWELIGRAF